MNIKGNWAALALLALASLALARAPDEVRKQVEASMLLTGTIDIKPDGSVGGYAIDAKEKVPDYVLGNITRQVPGWKFEPVLVDGKPVPARTRMSLRVIAKPAEDGNFLVSLGGVNFGEYSDDATDQVTRGRLRAPEYPREAWSVGGKGTVYLLLKIDRQGKVADQVVEQVNLTAIGDPRQMKKLRKSLGDASLKAARSWTFHLPTTGEAADAESWSIRVPVNFQLADDGKARYGTWQAYLPGPRQRASWVDDEDMSDSPDALADDGVYPVGGGPKLLTPLHQG